MAREQETPFLMGSILDGMTELDDQKDKLKESIASIRSQTFSAPPAMTLYDYDVLMCLLRSSPRRFSPKTTGTRISPRRN